MNKETKSFFGSFMLAIIPFLIVFVGIAVFSFNDSEFTVTVTDKERIVEGAGKNVTSKYLVFCEIKETGETIVFQNTDNLLRLKFNSSDIQGRLKEGHTYKVTVIGYRNPILSWYENIINAEEIKT